MTRFVAVKIHYDRRTALQPHLKYSVLPSATEYQEYLDLFREQGLGGDGFHECLNFAASERQPVRFYLPPTCLPAASRMDEEFVFFSFTYKTDQVLPSHVVGIHAGARLLSTAIEGVPRDDSARIEGVSSLIYHAEAPSELVTLLTPPLAYDRAAGRHSPAYASWGFGLRYLEDVHARNIVMDALQSARVALPSADLARSVALQRQIEVLKRIADRYQWADPDHAPGRGHPPAPLPLPDVEAGEVGERLVYERELAQARRIGQPASAVEWVSRVAPASPFDIKTVRLDAQGRPQAHYLEVKTSRARGDMNAYVSIGQIRFLEENPGQASVALVRLLPGQAPTVQELSLPELRAAFDLQPIKFRLVGRD